MTDPATDVDQLLKARPGDGPQDHEGRQECGCEVREARDRDHRDHHKTRDGKEAAKRTKVAKRAKTTATRKAR